MTYQTYFGSLDQFEKGTIELINDKATNYAFSNIFEVASRSKPYEKVVVGKNLQYVIETLRAEGESSWFAASHDEFAIVMDGEVEVNFIKLDNPTTIVPPTKEGSVRIEGAPVGKKMGLVRLKRGHQALLPADAAYQFRAVQRGALCYRQSSALSAVPAAGMTSISGWCKYIHDKSAAGQCGCPICRLTTSAGLEQRDKPRGK